MKAEEIIHLAHLTRGACREGIVNTLLESKTALSEQEIKSKLKDKFDRTSIYRTFKTLVKNGILHQINIEKGLVKYAVNLPSQNTPSHVHFYCSDCQKVICIDQPIPSTTLVQSGFIIQAAELVIKGKCPECNQIAYK